MELGIMQGPSEDEAGIAKKLGITWANCPMSVDDPDSIYLEFDRMGRMGIEPHGIVPYMQENIGEPLFFHQFSKYLRKAAKLFPFKSVEVWPEPACPYVTKSQVSFRDYHHVIQCGYESWKEIRPETKVYNGGIGQHGTLWSVQAFIQESIDFTDGLNLHFFQFNSNPHKVVELITGQLTRAALLLGEDKDVLCTEGGYPSHLVETSFGSFVDPLGIPAAQEHTQAWIIKNVLDALEPFCTRYQFCYIRDCWESHYWGGYTGLKVNLNRPEDREDVFNKPVYEAIKEWVKLRNYN